MSFELGEAFVRVTTEVDEGSLSTATGEVEGAFTDSLNGVGETATRTGGTITRGLTAPILGVVGAGLGLAVMTGNAADELLDLSATTGIGTDSLQEWRHVAAQAGTSQDFFASGTEFLNKRMSALADGTGPAGAAMEDLGISALDANGNLRAGEDVMEDAIAALAGIEDESERARIGSELFRGEWANVAPAVDLGADAIDEARDSAHELGRVQSGEALNASNDFRMEMVELTESLKGMGQGIMAEVMPHLRDLVPVLTESLVPALATVAGWVGDAVIWFTELSPTVQKVIIGAIGLAAALGPMLMVAGKVAFALTNLIGIGKLLAPIVMGVSWPVLAVVAAIAALVAVGWLVVKNWDTIKAWFGRTFQAIRDSVSRAVEAVKAVVSAVFSAIASFVTAYVSTVRTVVTTAFTAVRNAITNAVNLARTVATTAFQGIVSAIQGALSSAVSFVTGFPARVLRGLGNLGNLLLGAGKALIRGFVKGITSMISAPVDAVKGMLGKVRDFLPFSPAKEGPFSGKGYTLFSGEAIAGDLAKGITKQQGRVTRAVGDLMGEARGGLSASLAVAGGVSGASGGGGGNVTYVVENVELRASDLREVRDVAEFFQKVQQTARAGRVRR